MEYLFKTLVLCLTVGLVVSQSGSGAPPSPDPTDITATSPPPGSTGIVTDINVNSYGDLEICFLGDIDIGSDDDFRNEQLFNSPFCMLHRFGLGVQNGSSFEFNYPGFCSAFRSFQGDVIFRSTLCMRPDRRDLLKYFLSDIETQISNGYDPYVFSRVPYPSPDDPFMIDLASVNATPAIPFGFDYIYYEGGAYIDQFELIIDQRLSTDGNLSNVVLLMEFNSFLDISSLEVDFYDAGITLSTSSFYASGQDVNITGTVEERLLTDLPDDCYPLTDTLAIRLSNKELDEMRKYGVCERVENCFLYYDNFIDDHRGGLLYPQSQFGTPASGNFSLNDTLELSYTDPLTVLLVVEYFGYTAWILSPPNAGFSLRTSGAYQALVGMRCLAQGDAVNPRFLNIVELVPQDFIVSNDSTEVVLRAPSDFLRDGLFGYIQCQADSAADPTEYVYINGRIIHYLAFYFVLYEGSVITAEFGQNITIPFSYVSLQGPLYFSIVDSDGSFNVPFRWDWSLDEGFSPYGRQTSAAGTITIFDVQYSHEGFYELMFFVSNTASNNGFTLTVPLPEVLTPPIVVLRKQNNKQKSVQLTVSCFSDESLNLAWFDSNGDNLTALSGNQNSVNYTMTIYANFTNFIIECRVENPELANLTYFEEGSETMVFKIQDTLVAYARNGTDRVLITPTGGVPNSYRSFECIGDSNNGDLSWIITEGFNVGGLKTTLNGLEAEEHDMFQVTNVGGQYISLNILGKFEGVVKCTSGTSGDDEEFDVRTVALTEGVDYYPYINILNDHDGFLTTGLNGDTDGCTAPIFLDVDLPYGIVPADFIHVCANGLLTVSTPLVRWNTPMTFPTDNPFLADSNIVAPFWADVDLRDGARVYYKAFPENHPSLGGVSLFVGHQMGRDDFSAKWMFVAHWEMVSPFGFSEDYDGPNTFQAVIITDRNSTYALYTYFCGELNWGRGQSRDWAVIGYNINQQFSLFGLYDGDTHSNNPFSASSAVTDISCKNVPRGTRWSNVVYQVGQVGPENPVFQAKIECEELIQELFYYYSSASISIDDCPCTSTQALRDANYREIFLSAISADPIYSELRCFIRTFAADINLKQCCYNKFTRALSNAGGVSSQIRFNPQQRLLEYIEVDITVRQICEVGLSLDIYRAYRPAVSCDGYFPPRRALCAGDPHLESLDGAMFTFNGWGEYLLLRYQDAQTRFELQTRTEPVNITTSPATQLVAFAFAMLVDYPIEVRWLDGDFQVLLNREDMSAELANTNDTFELSHLRAVRLSDKSMLFSFPNQMGVAINITGTSLAFAMIVPDRFKGQTFGMIGNYNGDPSDDTTARNGTLYDMDTITDEQIHTIGQSWQLIDGESFFTYPDGKTYLDYSFPDHNPPGAQEVLDSAPDEIKEACNNNIQCIYDAIETNDLNVGLETMGTIEIIQKDDQLTRNSPPIISGDDRLTVTLGEETVYSFTVTDDSDTFDVRFSSDSPPGAVLNVVNTTGNTSDYELTFTLVEIVDVNIQIMAIDQLDAAFTLDVQVLICACQNDGNCSLLGVDNPDASSIVLTCQCTAGWDGRYCQNNYDGCVGYECFGGVACTDLPPPSLTAECGPCPDGYLGDGAKCADINECLNPAINDCEQLCVNSPGSWGCACRPGYQLAENGLNCEDIDECLVINGGCHQTCTNTIGGFICSCEPGLEFAPDGFTCIATDECGDNNCDQICYVVDGIQNCGCNPGYIQELSMDRTICVDINECELDLSPCDQDCTNTPGSFQCSCFPGYQMIDGVCTDIDECLRAAIRGSSLCDPSMTCVNSEGGYSCECPPGTLLAVDRCVDPVHIVTRPPVTVPTGLGLESVVIALDGFNVLAFDLDAQDLFKQATVLAILDFCITQDGHCPMTELTSRTKRLSDLNIDNVYLTDITDHPTALRVVFNMFVIYNGFVLDGDALVNAIESGINNNLFSSQGFSIQSVSQTTSPPGLSQTNLLIVIVVCSVGGALVLLLLFSFLCCCMCCCNKKRHSKKNQAGVSRGKNPTPTEIDMTTKSGNQGEEGVANIYQGEMVYESQSVDPVKIDLSSEVMENPIAH